MNIFAMATVIKCVRVFQILNSGDLVDKCKKNVDILCEYDPQGVNLKVLSGKNLHSFSLILHLKRCLTFSSLSRLCWFFFYFKI